MAMSVMLHEEKFPRFDDPQLNTYQEQLDPIADARGAKDFAVRLALAPTLAESLLRVFVPQHRKAPDNAC